MTRSCHLPALLILVWTATVFTVAAPRAPASSGALEGFWSGTVAAPQGENAAIALDFHRNENALHFRIYFPAMSLHGATLDLPVQRDGNGGYTIAQPLEIRLQQNGDRLSGTFGADLLPLTLERGGNLPSRPEAPVYPPAPSPLWRYPLEGGTWAPPVTDGETIFIGGSDGRFHAVNAATGTAGWVWPGTIPIEGAAALNEAGVYFMDTHYNLVALDRKTGAFRWRTPLHNEFLAGHSTPNNPTFNHRAATPLVHDGVIYVGSSDGGLYALSPASGAVLWRHNAGAGIYSGIRPHGELGLIFGTMDGSLVHLDLHARREIFRVRTGGGVVSTPLVSGDLLIAGSRDYNLHAFHLRDNTRAWKFSCWFSWIESSPVLREGVVYFGSSDYARLTALDPRTGRAHWSTRIHGLSWGSPLVTDRYVFAGTVNQNVPGTLIAHQAGLVKLDRASGAVLWRLALPDAKEGHFAGYAGGPALAGDRVVAAGLDGWLTAWPLD
jgi:outer membrane protein assembly factor BamB